MLVPYLTLPQVLLAVLVVVVACSNSVAMEKAPRGRQGEMTTMTTERKVLLQNEAEVVHATVSLHLKQKNPVFLLLVLLPLPHPLRLLPSVLAGKTQPRPKRRHQQQQVLVVCSVLAALRRPLQLLQQQQLPLRPSPLVQQQQQLHPHLLQHLLHSLLVVQLPLLPLVQRLHPPSPSVRLPLPPPRSAPLPLRPEAPHPSHLVVVFPQLRLQLPPLDQPQLRLLL